MGCSGGLSDSECDLLTQEWELCWTQVSSSIFILMWELYCSSKHHQMTLTYWHWHTGPGQSSLKSWTWCQTYLSFSFQLIIRRWGIEEDVYQLCHCHFGFTATRHNYSSEFVVSSLEWMWQSNLWYEISLIHPFVASQKRILYSGFQCFEWMIYWFVSDGKLTIKFI